MSFKDYSKTPSANTTLGDGTYIGPNMLRNKVRPALQQLAADGRALADDVEAKINIAKGDPGPAGGGLYQTSDYPNITGTGDDKTAIQDLAVIAASTGFPIIVTSNINIPTGVTATLSDCVVVFRGGKVTGGGTITFKGPVVADPVRIFDDTIDVKIFHQRQPLVYAEWWGAKPMANIRSKIIDASNVDSTAAWNKALKCGAGWDGNNPPIRFTIKVVALGWYALTGQITISKSYFVIEGKNPTYGGTGFSRVGTPDTSWADQAIIKISGSQFSVIERMGFKSVRSANKSTRMKAAIWTHWDGNPSGQDTQRRITFRNIVIGDNFGSFSDTAAGYDFENGILSGGTTNGNDDFHTVDNLVVDGCATGIRSDQSQAVSWDVRQYQYQDGFVMFHSSNGGSITGRNWYAARSTREGVFRFAQPTNSGAGMKINIMDFSCEHLEVGYFMSTNMPVQGKINGNWMNFTQDPPNATVSQSGSTLTCTGGAGSGTSEFFANYMIGQQLIFADGQRATISAVAADRLTATAADSKTVAAQDARLNDLQDFRRAIVFHAYEATAQYQIALECPQISTSTNFGTPNPGGTRIVLLDAPGAFAIRHHLYVNTAYSAVWGSVIAGGLGSASSNQPRMVDLTLDNCMSSITGYDSLSPPRQTFTFVGNYGQGADGIISLNGFRQSSNVPQVSRGTHHHFGSLAGAIPVTMVTQTLRGISIASKVMTVADSDGSPLLKGKRAIMGASFCNHDSNFTTGSGLFGVAIGTADMPFRFGFLANATTGSQITGIKSLGGVYYPSVNTTLQVRGIYGPSGTLSQSGTTVTASSATAFAATSSLVPANLVGSKIFWQDAAGNVTATATIVAVASDNTLTVSESQTVAAGTASIEYPVTAGKKFGISVLSFGADEIGFYEINRFNNSTLAATVS